MLPFAGSAPRSLERPCRRPAPRGLALTAGSSDIVLLPAPRTYTPPLPPSPPFVLPTSAYLGRPPLGGRSVTHYLRVTPQLPFALSGPVSPWLQSQLTTVCNRVPAAR